MLGINQLTSILNIMPNLIIVFSLRINHIGLKYWMTKGFPQHLDANLFNTLSFSEQQPFQTLFTSWKTTTTSTNVFPVLLSRSRLLSTSPAAPSTLPLPVCLFVSLSGLKLTSHKLSLSCKIFRKQINDIYVSLATRIV